MFRCLPQIAWITHIWPFSKHNYSTFGAVDERSGLLANPTSQAAPQFEGIPPQLSVDSIPDTIGQSLGRTQANGASFSDFLQPSLSKPRPNESRHEARSHHINGKPASYSASLTSTQFEPETSIQRSRAHSRSHSSLQADLGRSLEAWPRHGTQRFLPLDHFERLITPESIKLELEHVSAKSPIGLPSAELVGKIFKRFPKLFAILALSGLTEFIYDFVEEDLHDQHLPYRMEREDLFSNINSEYRVQCTEDWTWAQIHQFNNVQWSLTAPVFRRTSDVEHYKIDDNQVMPFVYDASEDPENLRRGGFGEVYKVIIHPAHQFLSKTFTSSKVPNPAFAVKKLFVREKAEFDREVAMLKSFGGDRHHSHLAELVATFEYRGRFHLIFPFAQYDLRTYWRITPCPEFSLESVGWFLHQVKGLSSAVHKIHGYKLTEDELQSENVRKFGGASLGKQTTEVEPLYCCIHGDIKAENILWSDEDSRDGDPLLNFAGVLILTDFGQMRKYQIVTELRKPLDKIADTPAYAPPETTNPVILAHPSRTHDMWSLGCVYLEFTIWLLCDWEKLEKFTRERGATFYSKHKLDNNQPADEAAVNLCVQGWITTLHREPRCSKFIHNFLSLISRMLDVTPSKRIRSGPLNSELATLLRRAKQDSEYLTRPCPTHALCCCQRIQNHNSFGVENLCPRPKEGKPLPLRPSVLHVQQSDPSQEVRPKRSPDQLWDVATQTKRFWERESSNMTTNKWFKIVSTFHIHDEGICHRP